MAHWQEIRGSGSVLVLKLSLAVGVLNLLLVSCVPVAAKDFKVKRSKQEPLTDIPGAEEEGSGTNPGSTPGGKFRVPPRWIFQSEWVR